MIVVMVLVMVVMVMVMMVIVVMVMVMCLIFLQYLPWLQLEGFGRFCTPNQLMFINHSFELQAF